jgi:hypothetical protein
MKYKKKLKSKYVKCGWHLPGSYDVPIVERSTGRMVSGRKAKHLDSVLPQTIGICDICANRVRTEYGQRRKPLYERMMKIVKGDQNE